MRFLLVANPNAARFRNEPKLGDDLFRATSGRGIALSPASPDALERELAEIDPREVPLVAVAGGDGTVSHFVTAAFRVWGPSRMPPVGLLTAGTMNTIAKSLGVPDGTPAAQLDALLSDTGTTQTQRWPLEVGRGRFGFLFGTGIIPRYIQAYEAGGDTGPKKAASVLRDKVLAAILGGADAEAFFARHRCDIVVDGRLLPLKDWLLVAIGATHDLGLGFRPFPGLLDQPATLGLYATSSTPARFAWDLPAIRFQRPVRHPLCFQQLGAEVLFTSPEPLLYNLDGELEVGPTSLLVSSGPPLVFTLPPGAKPPPNKLGP